MSQTVVSKADVRGTASGVMFMAFFGTVWANVGIGGLQASASIWLLILAVVIGAVLFFSGMALIRGSRNLSNTNARRSKNVDKWFNIIFVTEFALIIFAAIVCNAIGHFDLFFPIMAIIVGVHFLPLAYLFQVRIYYMTGTLLCLLAIGTVLFVPLEVSLGQHQINTWWSLVGFGSMLILWITSVVILTIGRRLLRIAWNG
ncbi:hypothetical protein HUG15_16145 [Salicibibacter cibarius]|uniref:Uncharacterized protein n=1 Tax=Salicibibacter cibarius TaxID=2743000 RepID=A0A7T6Z4X6_9BACI|nr:hypothetical protein [Salicibibacter cibarius]QQK76951.1 hypothetical protein HUG15_16145 [Salicibibacter cibarius]